MALAAALALASASSLAICGEVMHKSRDCSGSPRVKLTTTQCFMSQDQIAATTQKCFKDLSADQRLDNLGAFQDDKFRHRVFKLTPTGPITAPQGIMPPVKDIYVRRIQFMGTGCSAPMWTSSWLFLLNDLTDRIDQGECYALGIRPDGFKIALDERNVAFSVYSNSTECKGAAQSEVTAVKKFGECLSAADGSMSYVYDLIDGGSGENSTDIEGIGGRSANSAGISSSASTLFALFLAALVACSS
jgi:hypothetical protein